jgi:hypothetical protein
MNRVLDDCALESVRLSFGVENGIISRFMRALFHPGAACQTIKVLFIFKTATLYISDEIYYSAL